jgi:hypothetical protein
MSKAKMKFPPIPGETPRAKFENLLRHLFSVPKKSEGKEAAKIKKEAATNPTKD